MSKITLEKTYGLLEKLADYVMEKIPAIESKLDQKADKADIQKLTDILDQQAKNIDTLRIEQLSQSKTLDRIDKRVTDLETRESGYRVRDKDD